jgi:hypothetical protein
MFDPKRLVAEVRALAAEKPDYVYQLQSKGPSCVYVEKGVGSCIVGQAALRAGMDLEELSKKDSDEEDTSVSVQFEDYGLSAEELLWLSKVQHSQDTQFPWGAAVARADDSFPGVK